MEVRYVPGDMLDTLPLAHPALATIPLTVGQFAAGMQHANRPSSELGREKMWARIHLIPLLQAEEDRDQVRRYWADQEREKELLGTNNKVYNSDRYGNSILCQDMCGAGITALQA